MRALPAPTLLVKTTVVARVTKTPACHLRCGGIGAAKLPMRSAAADGVTSTLPLVASTVAPLIEEATVIGDANAAPRHLPAPGRAGAGRNPAATKAAAGPENATSVAIGVVAIGVGPKVTSLQRWCVLVVYEAWHDDRVWSLRELSTM